MSQKTVDRRLQVLSDDQHRWWISASFELHSERFHGPEAEKQIREACNLVALATKCMEMSAEISLAPRKLSTCDFGMEPLGVDFERIFWDNYDKLIDESSQQ